MIRVFLKHIIIALRALPAVTWLTVYRWPSVARRAMARRAMNRRGVARRAIPGQYVARRAWSFKPCS